MGSYKYLIDRKNKTRVEAYKSNAGGLFSGTIEESGNLIAFLEHCYNNSIKIEVVHESWFDDSLNVDTQSGEYYKDFQKSVL